MGLSIKKFMQKNGVGYLFILPFAVLFTVFVVAPVVVAIGTSFTQNNMIQPPRWVGLTNYRLLFMDDDIFMLSLRNTFVFAFITGPLGYILSFFAAWFINQLKFKSVFSLAFYVPSITSGVAMGAVWLYFFSPDSNGLINNFLLRNGFIQSPVLWTLDASTILPVIMIISIWMSMGTGFLVLLAGLQNVSPELYEAAAIDGVKSKLQELTMITLPLLKPQMLFGAISTIAGSFAVFDISVAVAGQPSPNYAGATIVTHLHDYAFLRFQMGYASSIAVVLFVLTFSLGRIVMRLLRDDT